MTTAQLIEPAPAKINLYLEVLRRRPDGYHDLDSLAVFLDVSERLTFQAADELALAIKGPFASKLAKDADNLVLKAARALAERVGISAAAHITLDKRIPVAAGLGGGSADAAATLRGLNKLWGLNLGLDELAAIGAAIGADVPACVYSRPVYLRGTGGQIELAEHVPPLNMVIVNPRRPVLTADVFKSTTPSGGRARRLDIGPDGDFLDLIATLKRRRNDLEATAIALEPAVGDCLAALDNAPFARMSGSGASCFALFEDDASRAQFESELTKKQPDWFIAAGLSAGRTPNCLNL